jgi:hypothetical protein
LGAGITWESPKEDEGTAPRIKIGSTGGDENDDNRSRNDLRRDGEEPLPYHGGNIRQDEKSLPPDPVERAARFIFSQMRPLLPKCMIQLINVHRVAMSTTAIHFLALAIPKC